MNASEVIRLKIDEMLRPVLTEAGRRPIHEAIDVFARDCLHEAAEAIRNEAERASTVAWAEPMFIAADLIDPEVES